MKMKDILIDQMETIERQSNDIYTFDELMDIWDTDISLYKDLLEISAIENKEERIYNFMDYANLL